MYYRDIEKILRMGVVTIDGKETSGSSWQREEAITD